MRCQAEIRTQHGRTTWTQCRRKATQQRTGEVASQLLHYCDKHSKRGKPVKDVGK